MVGRPAGELPIHEYLNGEGGYGMFGVTGPKIGSYALNRWQDFTPVTKDMWYGRILARLTGEPLWAEMFERYVRTGQSSSTAMGRVLGAFRAWLADASHGVVKSPGADSVHPRIPRIFDRMLAAQTPERHAIGKPALPAAASASIVAGQSTPGHHR